MTNTALANIIASFLLLCEKVMTYFVTLDDYAGAFNENADYCGQAAFGGELTVCGNYIAQEMASLVAALVSLGSAVLPALGAGATAG